MKDLYFKQLEELEFELFVAKDLNYHNIAKTIERKIKMLEKKIKEAEKNNKTQCQE